MKVSVNFDFGFLGGLKHVTRFQLNVFVFQGWELDGRRVSTDLHFPRFKSSTRRANDSRVNPTKKLKTQSRTKCGEALLKDYQVNF
jgi:hypothetical protein